MGQLRNRYFLIGDLVLLALAAYLSYVLRLDGFDLTGFRRSFVVFAGLVVLITPVIFLLTGIYARYWRYASVEELQLLAGALAASVVLASGICLVVLRFVPGGPFLPRSIPVIFLLLALPATAGPRLAVRLLADHAQRRHPSARPLALVMGAGAAGAIIARESRNNSRVSLDVIGFLDDDPRKRGMRIHGIPVLGNRHDLPQVVDKYHVQQVIIAMPTAPGKTVREVVAICEQAGVRPKIIPGIYELMDGRANVSQLRDVEIEDLLRREPIRTDTAGVRDLVRGKRVLITGGGGSIGSELCRQIIGWQPAELIVVGHGENSVFVIQHELQLLRDRGAAGAERQESPADPGPRAPEVADAAPDIAAVVADVRFAERVRAVFEEYRPEIVFHAAAHKHVTLMERNPAEAITNNVIGTKNLLDAALATGVDHFVMISTDKAVNPTSVMGASKRAAELLVHRAARQSGKAYVAVRFGNVLGSRGSVVPKFKQQIAAGGPVTVTDPEMVRYFMTIPEAVQLVLQAAVLGKGGEVFVLDMGEPVKIVDLARDLIELSGLEMGRDIDIVFTGIQPGEKLFEELFVPGESYQRTLHEKVFIANNASRFVPLRLDEAVQVLAQAADLNDRAAILHGLQCLVPEFQSTGASPVEDGRRVEQG